MQVLDDERLQMLPLPALPDILLATTRPAGSDALAQALAACMARRLAPAGSASGAPPTVVLLVPAASNQHKQLERALHNLARLLLIAQTRHNA